MFTLPEPSIYAHRYAAMREAGRESLATKEFVIHSCDNPPCCNPRHLTIADHAGNMADMDAKNRRRTLDRKLTFALAEEIRRQYAAGDVLQRELAEQFGVCQQTVSEITRGLIRRRQYG